ncbi:MAG TPA: STAS domain-containing protein [Bryobacteraceae bacterium]|nr:STAS domain-containing protein [Bryobacteraceae bacterium]
MSLKINVRESGNVVILDLDGRITIGEEATSLRDTIKEMLDGGHRHILLNLADVSYIDSTGLGQFVGSFATVTSRGGELKLLNLQKRLQELMQITKLITVFETFTSETAAVHSFPQTASA